MNDELNRTIEFYQALIGIAWGALVMTPIMLMFVCGILSYILTELRNQRTGDMR